jgi:hypothetical protein
VARWSNRLAGGKDSKRIFLRLSDIRHIVDLRPAIKLKHAFAGRTVSKRIIGMLALRGLACLRHPVVSSRHPPMLAVPLIGSADQRER